MAIERLEALTFADIHRCPRILLLPDVNPLLLLISVAVSFLSSGIVRRGNSASRYQRPRALIDFAGHAPRSRHVNPNAWNLYSCPRCAINDTRFARQIIFDRYTRTSPFDDWVKGLFLPLLHVQLSRFYMSQYLGLSFEGIIIFKDTECFWLRSDWAICTLVHFPKIQLSFRPSLQRKCHAPWHLTRSIAVGNL